MIERGLLNYSIKECDFCDEKDKVCAVMNNLCNDISVICIECLNKIVIEAPCKVDFENEGNK